MNMKEADSHYLSRTWPVLNAVLKSERLLPPEIVARGVGCPQDVIEEIESFAVSDGENGWTWLSKVAKQWGALHSWMQTNCEQRWGRCDQEPSKDVAGMTRTVLGIIEKSNLLVIDRWQVQRTCWWLNTQMSLLAGLAESQPTCEDPKAISEGER